MSMREGRERERPAAGREDSGAGEGKRVTSSSSWLRLKHHLRERTWSAESHCEQRSDGEGELRAKGEGGESAESEGREDGGEVEEEREILPDAF